MSSIESIKIEATPKSPFVILDALNGTIEITGRSIPFEGAKEFYTPIIDWVNKYVKYPQSNTVVKINLEYFNTRTIDALLTILRAIETIEKPFSYEFLWYLHDDDDDCLEAIADLNSALKQIKIQPVLLH